MVQYEYIRFMYFNQNKKKREIARELGIHRNTVTRAIENPEQKYNMTVEREKPVNGNFKYRIETLIRDNHAAPKNQRLTKKRMHTLLTEEGYPGSYSAFTHIARQIEEELGINSQETYVKLEPIRGSMQVDFGEGWVIENGVTRKKYIFCAKLCYSKGEFVKAYPGQSTEFLFDGLISAFSFFNGVPCKVIFDNLKPAVKKVLQGSDRELQEEFIKFKSYYCFEAIFCGPAKGHEKGMVENLVKYIKNNYLLSYPDFVDFESFNDYLIQECYKRLYSGIHKGEAWTKLLLMEEFLLIKDIYQYARIKDTRVDTYQLIHVDRNRYSVPTHYVGKRVQVRIYPFELVVSYKGEIMARHERLFGRDKEYLDPYHYLDLLQRKARAYDQAKVIIDWELSQIYERYHRRLQVHRESNSKGTREFIDILRLTEDYGIDAIGEILKQLDDKNQLKVGV